MAVSFSEARVSLGVLCVVAIAGCGGRTSTLTPEDYPGFGSSEPSGGSTGVSGSPATTTTTPPTPSGGGSSISAAGAPNTGVAGAPTAGGSSGIAGAPSTGAGGGAGATSSNAVAACKNFCGNAAMSACSNQFGDFSDCVDSCSGELSSSPLCLQLGQAVMNCFLPIIQGSAGNCSNIDDLVDAKCAPQLDQFQPCSDSGETTPAPPPVPLPIPEPAPNCGSQGTSSQVTCNLTSKCTDGSFYAVNCKQSAPNESSCICQSGNGTGSGSGAGFTLHESVALACYDAVSACGGPIPTLPK